MEQLKPQNGIDLDTLVLSHGGHMDKDAGTCVMEAANNYHFAYHSDRMSVCDTWINSMMMGINDTAPSVELLQRLKKFIPLLPKTGTTRGRVIPESIRKECEALQHRILGADSLPDRIALWEKLEARMWHLVQRAVELNEGRRKKKKSPEAVKQDVVSSTDFDMVEEETPLNTLKA